MNFRYHLKEAARDEHFRHLDRRVPEFEQPPLRPTSATSKARDRLLDLCNLAVGTGLFLSPWVLGFGAGSPDIPTQSAGVAGTLIAVLSLAALLAFEVWEEWLILCVAACALLSPWIFGFAGTSAMVVHLAAGVLSVSLAIARLVRLPRLSP